MEKTGGSKKKIAEGGGVVMKKGEEREELRKRWQRGEELFRKGGKNLKPKKSKMEDEEEGESEVIKKNFRLL